MLTFVILTIIGIQSTIGLEIKAISGPPNNLTDSAFWREETQSFYWSDYWTFGNGSSIFRYDYKEQRIYSAYVEGKTETAYLIPVKQCGKYWATHNNLFLSGSLHDNYLIDWNGVDAKAKVLDTIFRIDADIPESHMVLGLQNQLGVYVGGTTSNAYCLGATNSSLYSYTRSGGVKVLYTGFKSTAGVVFEGNKIYHNDVCRQKIEVLQRDIFGNCKTLLSLWWGGDKMDQWNITTPDKVKEVFDFTKSTPPILPSGLAIDSRGYLYTTGSGSGTIWQINPKKSTAEIIATLPSKYVTAVDFGGPKRDILMVVASAVLFNRTLNVVDYAPGPPLYMINGLGAQGVSSPKMSCY